jgi:hypothetical protein
MKKRKIKRKKIFCAMCNISPQTISSWYKKDTDIVPINRTVALKIIEALNKISKEKEISDVDMNNLFSIKI